MKHPLAPLPGEIVVLRSPPTELLLSLVAVLAMNGPVLVLDANNQFDAFRLARLIRKRTPDLYRVLRRVRVSRAFTCYQVVTLFDQLPPATMPHVVFDLPATFYDESVTPEESRRLFQLTLNHVRRLSHSAPILLAVHSPQVTHRAELLAAVTELADRLLTWETPPAPVQPRLFA